MKTAPTAAQSRTGSGKPKAVSLPCWLEVGKTAAIGLEWALINGYRCFWEALYPKDCVSHQNTF
jgi:hypothetical protein